VKGLLTSSTFILFLNFKCNRTVSGYKQVIKTSCLLERLYANEYEFAVSLISNYILDEYTMILVKGVSLEPMMRLNITTSNKYSIKVNTSK
jgi:hypothetical protein